MKSDNKRFYTEATIEIGARGSGSERAVFVRDNGASFDMQYADKGTRNNTHRGLAEEDPAASLAGDHAARSSDGNYFRTIHHGAVAGAVDPAAEMPSCAFRCRTFRASRDLAAA
jgi:hypothetical protein